MEPWYCQPLTPLDQVLKGDSVGDSNPGLFNGYKSGAATSLAAAGASSRRMIKNFKRVMGGKG